MATVDSTGKIPRLPNMTLAVRFVIGGLGIAALLSFYLGVPDAVVYGEIVVSALVGWYFQKRYDQETNAGVADGSMYIKRGEKDVKAKS